MRLRNLSLVRNFCVAMIGVWLIATGAAAEPPHETHYRAYVEALAAGDRDLAIAEAEASWRAAEALLGDDETTAILAYNYANLIYNTRPEDAIEPIRRVIALTGEADEMFGADAPIVILLLAEASAEDAPRTKIVELRKKLTEREQSGAPPSAAAARGWTLISNNELDRRRFDRAKEAADYALTHMRGLDASNVSLASTLVLGAMTRVAGSKRNKEDVAEAIEMLDEAIDLFPPQISIESFDPLLAKALAWRAATTAAIWSDNSLLDGPRSRKYNDPDQSWRIKWVNKDRLANLCKFDWKKRTDWQYPNPYSFRRELSSVVIGYHLDEMGRTTDLRILAEVSPHAKFGRNTLKEVSKWALKEPPPVQCRSNHIAIFYFYIA